MAITGSRGSRALSPLEVEAAMAFGSSVPASWQGSQEESPKGKAKITHRRCGTRDQVLVAQLPCVQIDSLHLFLHRRSIAVAARLDALPPRVSKCRACL